ncbi:MAG: NAD/NADP octopine/nopaline dehydrogenase family protein [Desulfobacteraceae bacterium]|nr:NAD/NADP octopine/nopaline dehydrogenase family protein [Desulfobacteraceae bacterium]
MAAHLSLMGFKVSLYNRTPKNVEAIKERGGITLESQESGPKGFGKLTKVTSNMQEALQDSNIIMVVVPAYAHVDIAKKVAPHLVDGQIVILNPGRTLGALEFLQILRGQGCEADVIVAETQTFIYASRSIDLAQARIFRIKDAVPLAALPSSDTAKVLEAISPAFPQFIDGANVLQTGLNNIGGIFHPTISLLNAGWIESTGGDFQFYLDGVTPTIALIMEAIDRERVNVASVLGVQAITALEWLKMAYNTTGENLYKAIRNQQGYRGINAPQTLDHRYIHEDIPMSLVPVASMGHRFGVSVRAMDSLIRMAIIANRTDYWRFGRTLENLGIEQLSAKELLSLVNGGIDEKEQLK